MTQQELNLLLRLDIVSQMQTYDKFRFGILFDHDRVYSKKQMMKMGADKLIKKYVESQKWEHEKQIKNQIKSFLETKELRSIK